jgi:hypothetical protein
MTSVHLPGMRQGAGIQDYGRKEPSEMIAMIKGYAQLRKEEAEAILQADDADFRVETYIGSWAQKKREIVQQGRAPALQDQSK